MADTAETILETDLSPELERKMSELVGQFPYTTTALFAIARFCAENDDDEGYLMVLAFVKRFAVHEAETL